MVNINNVYQTVLVITNKDNRGYITPDEFNRLAEQAQNEIFASYFAREAGYELNAFLTSDFSDPNTYLAEKINVFYKSGTLTKAGDEFTYPSDLYRVGIVSVSDVVADRASHEEIKYINLTPLTYPVKTQPVYTLSNTGVVVYPSDITSGVKLDYLKKPIRPKWGYVLQGTIPYYDPTVFDPANDSYDTAAKSYNFELHPSEENNLVVKILNYSGVVIKQQDVAGFAQGKENQNTSQEQ
jgi:hypothetical protein|tara:strand:- start:3223 stop:3939 length:717 start_codon:yes stop_codon:yes gene_type:complete